MKKVFVFLITFLMCTCLCITAYAQEEPEQEMPQTVEETTVDASQPRLMVTAYKLNGESIAPDSSREIEITVKNYSQTKAVQNIKLSLSDETGDVKAKGMPTQYVERIYAGSSYTWKLELTASKNASIGEHILNFTAEYEDKYYTGYSSSDNISVTVTQLSDLDYSGIQLPVKVTQGETQTVSVKLMNTGKTTLSNCKVDFNVDGFESAGTLFIGEIAPGESKDGSINLRVSAERLGEVSGKATVSYEDELGEVYTKEAELSSLIEEKVEVAEEPVEEEKSKYPMWWLFLIVGVIVGGAAGYLIPTAIRSHKQRKEDELRL